MFEKTPQEAAGHNSETPKQTYYFAHGLPPSKIVWMMFFYLGVNKASYILGNLAFLRILSERS